MAIFSLTLWCIVCRNLGVINGDRSSVGRAPVCGTGCRGFEPRRSPQLKKVSRKRNLFLWVNTNLPKSKL